MKQDAGELNPWSQFGFKMRIFKKEKKNSFHSCRTYNLHYMSATRTWFIVVTVSNMIHFRRADVNGSCQNHFSSTYNFTIHRPPKGVFHCASTSLIIGPALFCFLVFYAKLEKVIRSCHIAEGSLKANCEKRKNQFPHPIAWPKAGWSVFPSPNRKTYMRVAGRGWERRVTKEQLSTKCCV